MTVSGEGGSEGLAGSQMVAKRRPKKFELTPRSDWPDTKCLSVCISLASFRKTPAERFSSANFARLSNRSTDRPTGLCGLETNSGERRWCAMRHEMKYATATLHEAAGRTGALPARLKPAFAGAELMGPAFTVSVPRGDNLWIHHAIIEASPGDVLVVAPRSSDDDAEEPYGYWGEILSEAAKARGLAGVVIDGGVRDTLQLAEVGFPVFSAAVAIRGTVKDPTAGGNMRADVCIGEHTVRCGDMIYGDADGVFFMPASDVDTVLANAKTREDHEAEIITRLRRGQTTIDLFDLPAVPVERVG